MKNLNFILTLAPLQLLFNVLSAAEGGSTSCCVPKKGEYQASCNDCRSCAYGCATCTGGAFHECSTCQEGFSYQKESKMCILNSECEKYPGHYVSGGECAPCHSSCEKCTGSAPNKCKECKWWLYFKEDEGTCISPVDCQKLDGYYISGKQCKKCHSACKSCTAAGDIGCKTCADGFIFKDIKCVPQTECDVNNGRYVYKEFCGKCSNGCQKCYNYKLCFNCMKDWVLTPHSTCIEESSCKAKTGSYVAKNQCKNCNFRCKDCNGPEANDCTACEFERVLKEDSGECIHKYECNEDEGYYLDGAKCRKIIKCEDNQVLLNHTCVPKSQCAESSGYFVSGALCWRCNSDCQQCSGHNQCTQCRPNFYLKGQSCVTETECLAFPGTFLSMGKCLTCPEGCSSCDNKGVCQECKYGYYFYEATKSCVTKDQCNKKLEKVIYKNKCITEIDCPLNNKVKDGICYKCVPNCKTCDASGKCLECDKGFFNKEGTKCLAAKECQENGNFISGSDCKSCYSGCARCDGPTFAQCLACPAGMVNLNGQCISKKQCADKGTHFLNETHCVLCDPSCKGCTGKTKFDCTECANDMILSNENACIFKSECNLEAGNFISDSRCKQCGSRCNKCLNEHHCLKCKGDFFLKGCNCLNKHECQNLGSHFIKDHYCESCHPSCKECTGTGENQCSSCHCGFLLKSGDNVCVHEDACGKIPGYFPTPEKCEKCHFTCEKCTGSSEKECTVCKEGRKLVDGKCVLIEVCDETKGYFMKNDKCYKCEEGCLKCKSKEECEKCDMEGYYLEDGICKKAQECDKTIGTFFNDGKCSPCQTVGCKDCKNQDTCNTCDDGYNYDKDTGKCVKPPCEPKENQYVVMVNGKKECKDCDATCKTCKAGSNKDCTECELPMILINGVCMKPQECKVDQGFYIENGICKQCKKHCLQCNNDKECIKCDAISVPIEPSDCITPEDCKKKPGFYYDEKKKKCLKCHGTCKECSGPTENDCTACTEPLFYKPDCGKCIKLDDIPPGYYYNPLKWLISPCHVRCKTCVGPTSMDCLECNEKCKGETSKILTVSLEGDRVGCVTIDECKQQVGKRPMIYDGLCAKCPTEGCSKCTDDGICQECVEGLILLKEDQKCVKKVECPTGMFGQKGQNDKGETILVCKPCDISCHNCNDDTKCGCTSCKKGFLRLESEKKCVPAKECNEQSEYYKKGDQCIQCPTPMKTCRLNPTTQLVEALTCLSNYKLINGNCINNCDYTCDVCTNGKPLDCLKCSKLAPFYIQLENSAHKNCFAKCPEGYSEIITKTSSNEYPCVKNDYYHDSFCPYTQYFNEHQKKCVSCDIPHCKICGNSGKCKVAAYPYFVKDGVVVHCSNDPSKCLSLNEKYEFPVTFYHKIALDEDDIHKSNTLVPAKGVPKMLFFDDTAQFFKKYTWTNFLEVCCKHKELYSMSLSAGGSYVAIIAAGLAKMNTRIGNGALINAETLNEAINENVRKFGSIYCNQKPQGKMECGYSVLTRRVSFTPKDEKTQYLYIKVLYTFDHKNTNYVNLYPDRASKIRGEFLQENQIKGIISDLMSNNQKNIFFAMEICGLTKGGVYKDEHLVYIIKAEDTGYFQTFDPLNPAGNATYNIRGEDEAKEAISFFKNYSVKSVRKLKYCGYTDNCNA